MKKEIEAYINAFPPEIRDRLLRIREIFLEEVPGADEGIRYRMPTVLWHGNLIHYAAFTKHIGVYPLPQVVEAIRDEIRDCKTGKGSIQFSNNRTLPEDTIRKIVRLRLDEKRAELAERQSDRAGAPSHAANIP